MKVHNYMEDIVEFILPEILKERTYDGQCTCEHCINDIKAIALNNLPPKYVTTKKGEILSKVSRFNLQSEINVKTALIEAIEKVNKNTRHRVHK